MPLSSRVNKCVIWRMLRACIGSHRKLRFSINTLLSDAYLRIPRIPSRRLLMNALHLQLVPWPVYVLFCRFWPFFCWKYQSLKHLEQMDGKQRRGLRWLCGCFHTFSLLGKLVKTRVYCNKNLTTSWPRALNHSPSVCVEMFNSGAKSLSSFDAQYYDSCFSHTANIHLIS